MSIAFPSGLFRCRKGACDEIGSRFRPQHRNGERILNFATRLTVAAALAAAAATAPALAADTPKGGGTLTYMISADAPPSLDGHREQTFATVQATAPFYSVLIRIDPQNPSSDDFVCDLCTELPEPTDGGKTYTFKIRDGIKFHDGSPLTAADVAANWQQMTFPPEGVFSARSSVYQALIEKIENPDPSTVVFRLKFATSAFLPMLADPFAYIYKKDIIEKDPHWYEKNVLGSGPFKFVAYDAGQSIKGERNPDYYHKGLPYLDGFNAIFAPKQATRVEAIRGDRAAIDFRGLPPSARDELKKELGDKVAVQESVWNCGSDLFFNHKQKPFDDPRVRRALSLAIDRWGGAPALSKIAVVKAVGGIVFPEAPLAATKAELEKMAGFWPDIEKSRAEAKRLLKEAGAENLTFELLNRDVDQPYKYVGIWLVDQWSKIGVKVTQKVVPTGPWFQSMRSGQFSVVHYPICRSVVNPVLDVQPYLPVSDENYGDYKDDKEMELYNNVLHETDSQKQHALMTEFQKYVMDDQAHAVKILWWNRIVPYRSYLEGWKISPSHFLNQDLSTVWLNK
jgi:peptide/nickel transport system substrate-binding protein